MSLTLINNPVTTVSGVVNNLFAGFDEVEFDFKREDEPVISVGLGAGTSIRITIATDLSSYLEVGDFIYLYAEGSGGYIYDTSGAVTAVTATTIDVDIDYIEGASSGYINYKKNWYLEGRLTNVDNQDIKVLDFSLIDDGDNAGNVTIDTSIANDLNDIIFEFALQELTESRVLFKLEYREVWDESTTGSFTLIDSEIILVYATEQPEIEAFQNTLDDPKIYKGYPFGVVLAHSDENSDDDSIQFTYDELDINQGALVSATTIGEIPSDDEGFLFVNLDKDNTYNADTEYIKFNAEYKVLTFFDPAFFDDTFFDA